MANQKGHTQRLMLSLKAKEATYDAAVTPIDATKFVTMQGYPDLNPAFDDKLVTDESEVSGSEYITQQDIAQKGIKFNYSEPHARPSSIIALMSLAMGGAITATKDGIVNAWSHEPAIAAVGAALPSVNGVWKKGLTQKLLKGLMINSVELKSEEGGGIALSAEFIGSGTRADDASAIAALISEPRLFAKNANVWRESGANISISPTLTQGLQNISSGVPTDLKKRMKSWTFKFSNGLTGMPGMGGNGVFQDLDFTRRKVDLSCVLRYLDTTEEGYYDNQTALAFELDFKHPNLIAAGAMYWGFQVIVPKFQLNKNPTPQGGLNDIIHQELAGTVMYDGTNPICRFIGYSGQSAYLA